MALRDEADPGVDRYHSHDHYRIREPARNRRQYSRGGQQPDRQRLELAYEYAQVGAGLASRQSVRAKLGQPLTDHRRAQAAPASDAERSQGGVAIHAVPVLRRVHPRHRC